MDDEQGFSPKYKGDGLGSRFTLGTLELMPDGTYIRAGLLPHSMQAGTWWLKVDTLILSTSINSQTNLLLFKRRIQFYTPELFYEQYSLLPEWTRFTVFRQMKQSDIKRRQLSIYRHPHPSKTTMAKKGKDLAGFEPEGNWDESSEIEIRSSGWGFSHLG